jgi:tRNA (cmo5U34)-methyltransferase
MEHKKSGQEDYDEVMPEGKWDFDSEVTDTFDNMLSRSIPQYEVMRKACFDVGARFVQPDTAVVDLGCSRGEAIAELVDRLGTKNFFVGAEISDPMLAACRERFHELIQAGTVDIRKLDLRNDYPNVNASLTMSVLCLQFTPIEHRQQILRKVFDHTVSGGAFILVEKLLGNSAELNNMMVDIYYKLKADHGYTQDQIERKRLSLEGVLVPVTAHWNEELLRMAGFRQIDCFWRWMNFAAWVGVKE